jgi:ABC-type phosphate/phosphonate transport system substrate-binding protein
MYAFERLEPAWEQLWSLVHRRAPWTPPVLRWEGDPHDHWRDQRCLVAMACGWPVMTELRHDVAIAGAFTLALDDADGHRYRSVVLANRPIDLADVAAGQLTAAVNATDSLSGWISLLAATVGSGNPWPGVVRWTGSHVASIRAVSEGLADIASVDSLTLAYLRRDRPDDVARLIELCRGPWVPSLPIVVRRGDAAERIDDLRVAIAASLDDPVADSMRAQLLLDGFVALDEAAYEPILEVGAWR